MVEYRFVLVDVSLTVYFLILQLWKKHYAIDGQVTQTLSPFEQNIISPMLHDVPGKVFAKMKEFALEAGPGLGLGIAVYYWAEANYKEQNFHHRD
jgi:hypothetical protein